MEIFYAQTITALLISNHFNLTGFISFPKNDGPLFLATG